MWCPGLCTAALPAECRELYSIVLIQMVRCRDTLALSRVPQVSHCMAIANPIADHNKSWYTNPVNQMYGAIPFPICQRVVGRSRGLPNAFLDRCGKIWNKLSKCVSTGVGDHFESLQDAEHFLFLKTVVVVRRKHVGYAKTYWLCDKMSATWKQGSDYANTS